MAEVTFREANKRYRRAFIPVMAFYTVAVFGGSYLLKQFETPPMWLSAIVALVMAAPIGGVLWLMWRLARETDEFTRQQQMASMAGGGMVTVFFSVVWGFLELYEVLPPLWTFLVGPIFFLSYGLIYCFGMKRGNGPGFDK
ncbi:MAG: hypothetical protein Q8R82_00450 [Hyphomonadaceae bacterium]|nr:hypothetical protein [Hyphomonadaceae bacterium]